MQQNHQAARQHEQYPGDTPHNSHYTAQLHTMGPMQSSLQHWLQGVESHTRLCTSYKYIAATQALKKTAITVRCCCCCWWAAECCCATLLLLLPTPRVTDVRSLLLLR
jgi:hypothetical protein